MTFKLSQHGLNVLLKILWLGRGGVALDGLSVLRDKELGEVPLDVTVLLHALSDGLEQSRCSLVIQAMIHFGWNLCL